VIASLPTSPVPLGDPAGEQHRLEARVELARQPHEGVAQATPGVVVHGGGSLRGRRRSRQAQERRSAGAQRAHSGTEGGELRQIGRHLAEDPERHLRLGDLVVGEEGLELADPLLDPLLLAVDLLEA
jgi:hypothetical protein